MSLAIQLFEAEYTFSSYEDRNPEDGNMPEPNFFNWVATILAITYCCLCAQGHSRFLAQRKQVDSDFIKKRIDASLTRQYLKYGKKLEQIRPPQSAVNPNVNVYNHPGEDCHRKCKEGDNRICYFQFTLEFYQTMGLACGRCNQSIEQDCNNPQCIVGDGVEKAVMSINRQVPGPPIQVCQNDLIIVDVHNFAHGTAASLHWHGVHQKETPYMDGVPFVTQCPINYASSFRYQFKATEAGTQFYHSHSGHHKTNGQYGVLTIRKPVETDPFSIFFDYDLPEHHVFIADWMHTLAEDLFPGLPSSIIEPDSVLINGRGVYTNPDTLKRTSVRPTIYYVQRGKRYLFRLVNSANHFCPFQMQIQDHNLLVIASDSFEVNAREFDTLISNAGERFDFILDASNDMGDYWMRVKGMGLCDNRNCIESYALVRYFDGELENNAEYMSWLKQLPVPPFPPYDAYFPTNAVLNHPNATCGSSKRSQCVTELRAFKDDEELRSREPDHKFFLAFDSYLVSKAELFKYGRYNHFENFNGNTTFVGGINKLTLVYPDFPPLTQPELIDENLFCDENKRPSRCKNVKICYCIHRIKVKKDSIVELIVVDETDVIGIVNHPFHLHGYKFLVAGIGRHHLGVPMTVKKAIEMESRSLLSRDILSPSPPFKDTVSIPSRGYAIVRLRASNPGFWMMHCHYEWHLAVGMGIILQVGEPSEMVKAPSNFPKCGNYLPPVKDPAFS